MFDGVLGCQRRKQYGNHIRTGSSGKHISTESGTELNRMHSRSHAALGLPHTPAVSAVSVWQHVQNQEHALQVTAGLSHNMFDWVWGCQRRKQHGHRIHADSTGKHISTESGTELNRMHSRSHAALGLPHTPAVSAVSVWQHVQNQEHALQVTAGLSARPAACTYSPQHVRLGLGLSAEKAAWSTYPCRF